MLRLGDREEQSWEIVSEEYVYDFVRETHMKQVVIVISHFRLSDQLKGFSGSSGPSQSTKCFS